MDTIFRGEIASRRGRRNAWLDALFVDHAILRLAWRNFGVVVPGRLFRSNHPTPRHLEAAVRRHGIGIVVNLRGRCGNGADALSRAAAHRLGLQFIDVPLRSRAAPPREILLALIDALDATHSNAPQIPGRPGSNAPPILVHCKSGADRAGFAAGVFLLLNGGSAADALGQLSLRHGHLSGARSGVLDELFRLFRDTAEGRMGFADWARLEYDPAALSHRPRVSRWAGALNDRILRRE